jgi:CRP-like cAMP-binding protein
MIRLIDLAQLRYLTRGTLLYSPQMILALLFVIGRGEVELRIGDRVIQTLSRGEVLNLELCLGERPHLLSAVVVSDVTLYVLPFDEVEVMLSHSSGLHQLQREAHLLRARALNE